jgi:glycerol-3-phosphate acyltransferase PlsX
VDLASVRTEDADRPVRVAVDAMGGDHAPVEIVVGSVGFARENPAVEVILVGDEAAIRGAAGGPLPANVALERAGSVIGMDEAPAAALRTKKDASIVVAMDMVKQGRADAVLTAGHTGAGMAAAVLRLGRLPGVDRPALAVQLITSKGPMVFLDIGANPDSTGENLYQYAHMGTLFAERVAGVAEPTVALLSLGEEKGKGDARVQRATELLDGSTLRFIGNVEGRDLVHHPADVVVCDAMLGNVTMKFFEGLSSFIFDMFAQEFRRAPRGPIAYALMRPGIDRIRAVFDYERLGGSPLLGVKGTVLITHGRSKRRMVGFGVGVAAAAARARIPERIAEAFGPGGAGRLPGDRRDAVPPMADGTATSPDVTAAVGAGASSPAADAEAGER